MTTTTTMTSRLDTIANRQRSTRARDFMFAAFIALATFVSVSSVGTAVAAAATHAAR